ncbi:MAG: glycoside hydrolase family 127 protein [Bacteroidetes bacterium]|nr:MAG: glycoside hydrolase family 127 protein [Bacteroidota bacterium]
MYTKNQIILGLCLAASPSIFAQQPFSELTPVGFDQVQINDAFWKPKMDKVSTVTLNACINYTEFKTARIRNFENAAKKTGHHEGIYYDDSDVYKALEAIAYSLQNRRDTVLEKKADEWIEKIEAAQMPDGYLDTYFQLRDISKRWTDIEKHEDYNAGHLIEAAVAYYHATGKDRLLQVATRLANHIDSTFRLAGKHWVSGHEEIELALIKLYHLTGSDRYYKLANWYLEQRGHGYGYSPMWTSKESHEYYQDDVPVKEASNIKGHAVRAMYLYTGTADVAAISRDTGYLNAMERVWQDVVYRNMYLTGGIGSSGNNEGFTRDYDLPNVDAYCETCASVGMVFWNQRMNLLTGESKYIDVLERTLYNGALSGLALNGDHFFYGNPLASPGKYERSEWFGTACCPANIARLIASLGNYIYNKSNDGIWVNLFIGSKTTIPIHQSKMTVEQETNYPWDGEVKIKLSPDKKTKMGLHVRIPGWVEGQPVPGDLYRFEHSEASPFYVLVNGAKVDFKVDKGYMVIEREWQKGDILTINFPVEVKKILAKDSVKEDLDRIAVQRGPLVYCFEQTDNKGKVWNMMLPPNTEFSTKFEKDLLGGVTVIHCSLPAIEINADGTTLSTQTKTVTAIPYFAWANREPAAMQVWLPVRIKDVKLNY